MDQAWYELDWIYGWVTVVIAAVGLVGLFWYAKQTAKIAKETELQGNILSKPTISVNLCSMQDDKGADFARVITLITNHSNVHANIKLKLEAHLYKAGEVRPRVFDAPTPYNGDIWPFSAKQQFKGIFTFNKLLNRPLDPDEKLWIEGTIESSAYDGGEYRLDPPIHFKWKASAQNWVADSPKPPSN